MASKNSPLPGISFIKKNFLFFVTDRGADKLGCFSMASFLWAVPGNTKGGRITLQLTSCLTGLD